jgi:hypothetical protein
MMRLLLMCLPLFMGLPHTFVIALRIIQPFISWGIIFATSLAQPCAIPTLSANAVAVTSAVWSSR